MEDKLGPIQISPKKGDDFFHRNGKKMDFNLGDYWKWSYSDLLSNASRGVLAEFIVAKALGLTNIPRNEWKPFDLETKYQIRIEVKSASYIQSWKQNKLSKINFNISPSYFWDYKTNKFSGPKKRQSQVYIFCILKHLDKSTIDPLNIEHWEFYSIPTALLDEKVPNQKSISLSRLMKLGAKKIDYG